MTKEEIDEMEKALQHLLANPGLWQRLFYTARLGASDLPRHHEQQAFQRLQGSHKHFCPEWDGRAIDETMTEFQSCLCVPLDTARPGAECVLKTDKLDTQNTEE